MKGFEHLSHAYLFSGNDEAKKQKTLQQLILELKCQPADVFSVSKPGEITIAEIRELSQRAGLSAWASPFKIFVIENAEKMNQEAQSALLKILEEPKGDTIFFLCTQYPFMLLPTICSRTQGMRFWKFSPKETIGGEDAKEFRDFEALSLEQKFEKSKKLSEEDGGAQDFVQKFLQYARILLLEGLETESPRALRMLKIVKLAQETLFLLRTTNSSPRLLLDRLFLSL